MQLPTTGDTVIILIDTRQMKRYYCDYSQKENVMPNVLTPTKKFSLSLSEDLFQTYEKEAAADGITATVLMRIALHRYAVEEFSHPNDGAFNIELYRWLTMEVAETAKQIVNSDGWDDHITLRATQVCQNRGDWFAGYKRLIGTDDVFARGNATKTSLHQNIGQYVKRALKARTKCDAAGKRMIGQPHGELVQTYTLLKRDT